MLVYMIIEFGPIDNKMIFTCNRCFKLVAQMDRRANDLSTLRASLVDHFIDATSPNFCEALSGLPSIAPTIGGAKAEREAAERAERRKHKRRKDDK